MPKKQRPGRSNRKARAVTFAQKTKTSFYIMPTKLNKVQHLLLDENIQNKTDLSQSDLCETLVSMWSDSPALRGWLRAYKQDGYLATATIMFARRASKVENVVAGKSSK